MKCAVCDAQVRESSTESSKGDGIRDADSGVDESWIFFSMGVCFTSFYFKAKRETTKRRGKKRFLKIIIRREKENPSRGGS